MIVKVGNAPRGYDKRAKTYLWLTDQASMRALIEVSAFMIAPFRSMLPPLHWPCTYSAFKKYPSLTFQHRLDYAAVMESLDVDQHSTGFPPSGVKVSRNRVVPHRSHL